MITNAAKRLLVAGTVLVVSLLALVACSGAPQGEFETPTPTAKPPTPTAGLLTVDAKLYDNEAIGSSDIFDRYTAAADAPVQRGKALLASGDYSGALDAFLEAKRRAGPPQPSIESYIGLTYQRLEQYDLAIEHHSTAISMGDNETVRINRASAYYANGQFDEALEDVEMVLSLPPVIRDVGYHSHVEAYTLMAYSVEHTPDALKAIDMALDMAEEYGGYDAATIGHLEGIRDELLAITGEN